MTDSDRLNARMEKAAQRKAEAWRPSLGTEIRRAVTELARRNVTDPNSFRLATDADMEAKEREIELERLTRQAEIRLSRLPSRYREADYMATPAGHAARRWTEAYRAGNRSGLVLMGTVGTGKTWLAAAIVRDLSINARPVPCTFITTADLLDYLRKARPGLDVDMVQFATAPVLVLDDFGQENRTEWANEQLYRLAHARSHNDHPTVVTTNLTGPEIHEKYESRTVQRLFGGSKKIELFGDSRRELPF